MILHKVNKFLTSPHIDTIEITCFCEFCKTFQEAKGNNHLIFYNISIKNLDCPSCGKSTDKGDENL